MSKKKKKPEESKKSRAGVWLIGGLILASGIAFAVLRESKKPDSSYSLPSREKTAEQRSIPIKQSETREQVMQEPASNFRMPPYLEDPTTVQLPPTLPPPAVSPPAQEAYFVAGQKPQLLAQMPCFCYCDRFGHSSLHTCFTTNHAEQCDICLKEALEANILDQEGMAIPEIRELIVSKYAPSGGHPH